MLHHSATDAVGQTNIQNCAIKGRDDVAPMGLRDEFLAATSKCLSFRRLWNEIFYLQISIAVDIDALWSARVIS